MKRFSSLRHQSLAIPRYRFKNGGAMAAGEPTLASLQAELNKQAILLEQSREGQQLRLDLLAIKHDLDQK